MLNEAQARHLTTTLRMTEERLLQLRQRLRGEVSSRTLLLCDNDVSDAERVAVTRRIDEALQLIADLSQQWKLAARSQSLRQTLIGTLSVTWADLQDAKAQALRRYGETDPRLGGTLDPPIDHIADILLAICRTVGENGK